MFAMTNLRKRIQAREAETRTSRLRIIESRQQLRCAIRRKVSSPAVLLSGFSVGWAAGRSPSCWPNKRPLLHKFPIKTTLPLMLSGLPFGLGGVISAMLLAWNV